MMHAPLGTWHSPWGPGFRCCSAVSAHQVRTSHFHMSGTSTTQKILAHLFSYLESNAKSNDATASDAAALPQAQLVQEVQYSAISTCR